MTMLRRAMKSQCSKFSTEEPKSKFLSQMIRGGGLTFSDAPWITTPTNFFAALNFDYGIGANDGEWDALSQLSHHFCLFLVFQGFGEVINFYLVLRDFVQNLKVLGFYVRNFR